MSVISSMKSGTSIGIATAIYHDLLMIRRRGISFLSDHPVGL